MSSNKITQLHVYIIGVVLMVIVGVGMFLGLIKPIEDKNKILENDIRTKETTAVDVYNLKGLTILSDPPPYTKAKAQMALALQTNKNEQARLAAMTAQRRLPRSQEINVGDGSQEWLLRQTMPRWIRLPRVVVTKMQQFAQQLARRHGVKVTTSFQMPPPGTSPDAIPRDIIARNLGPMTVEGDFNKVMAWMEGWNTAPLLSSVDGLKLDLAGRGGRVVGTTALTVYIFPEGKAVTPPDQAGFVAAGGGGGGGGGGMYGSMMSGMGAGMSGGMSGMSGGPPGGSAGMSGMMSGAGGR
jgi:hypothetical protein